MMRWCDRTEFYKIVYFLNFNNIMTRRYKNLCHLKHRRRIKLMKINDTLVKVCRYGAILLLKKVELLRRSRQFNRLINFLQDKLTFSKFTTAIGKVLITYNIFSSYNT